MRRTLQVTVLSIALAGLSLPAAAGADVIDTYQRLATRQLSPAPLVPTVVPPALTPADLTISTGTTIGGRGYSVRLLDEGRRGQAKLVVNGGEFRTMRALLREYRRLGFRGRPIRVRGHRGRLFTRRLGPLQRELVWTERGVIYTVGSGTPKRISLAHLRSTARGLDRLERDWIGTSGDPEQSSEAFAVTTAHTVSTHVTFDANCTTPGSSATTVRVGQAKATFVRRRGTGFAFNIADHRFGSGEWTGTVTGTVSATAITLEVRATATIDGNTCDTGPLRLTLDRRAIRER